MPIVMVSGTSRRGVWHDVASRVWRWGVLVLIALRDRSYRFYAGTVTIGALIERSASHRVMKASGQAVGFPELSPDVIADEIWTLVTKRDRVEAVLPPMPQSAWRT